MEQKICEECGKKVVKLYKFIRTVGGRGSLYFLCGACKKKFDESMVGVVRG